MNRPVTLSFARPAPVLDFGPAYRPSSALGRPRPAAFAPAPASLPLLPAYPPAVNGSATQFAATELGPEDDCFDGRSSVIARNAATTTVRSAHRARASKLTTERLAFAVLFVANAMLLGAILGLLVAGT